jgi:hypothetical protein
MSEPLGILIVPSGMEVSVNVSGEKKRVEWRSTPNSRSSSPVVECYLIEYRLLGIIKSSGSCGCMRNA